MAGTTTLRSKRLIVLLFAAVVPALVLGLLALIAISPIPMRGAEVFGGIANKIKGHPGATTYWTLFAGAMLWVVIGLIVAVQEWLAGRRYMHREKEMKVAVGTQARSASEGLGS